MAINASAGAKIYIGPTTAAADASAYAGLAYVEIGNTETLGEFGDSASPINFTGLADARVQKLKGPRDAGDLQLVVANNPYDPGQIALIAAEATPFDYAFKVVIPDGADANDTDTTIYFHAKVMSKRLNVGGASDVTKRTFTLGINTALVEVPAEAVS